MFTDMRKRRYTQKKRAERQAETHRRIVEATMELHEEVGAAQTTVSAVAERAGVQRLTVYRHFPDEAALLLACTSRWLELHPPPGTTRWAGVQDPLERVQQALRAFYTYYRDTEQMWENSHRDRDLVPALAQRMAEFEAYVDGVAAELIPALRLRGRRRRQAYVVVRHGLRFLSWQSFATLGLPDAAAAALVRTWLEAVVE